MIFKTRTTKQFEEENNNIIECEQEDNVQRSGVQSIHDEKKLLQRKGIGIYQKLIKPEEIDEENITEVNKYSESFDIIDEHRAEQAEIEHNKKNYTKIKLDTEKMINDLRAQKEQEYRQMVKDQQQEI